MSNEVLAETGDFALSIPVTLTHYGGATTTTRGSLSRLAQSPGQLEDSYSDSDYCCWCPEPENDTRVEYLTANSIRWRVLDSEPIGGGIFASVDRRTTRYMLVNEGAGVTPPDRERDFDPNSFDPLDFQ